MAGTRRRVPWAACAVAALVGGSAWADTAFADAAAQAARVRGADAASQTVIDRARSRSPTVAACLLELDSSDVVVIVTVTFMPGSRGGHLQMLASTPGGRYLVVRLDVTRSPEEQIELLGHELQHAKEVAKASDVKDQAGLVKLMARIGRRTWSGTYETDEAVRIGRVVRQEVLRR